MWKQLYISIFYNLDIMKKNSSKVHHTRYKKGEIGYLDSSIFVKEIEFANKIPPQKTTSDSLDFFDEFSNIK